MRHFPFGDEPTSTTQNREKFATYYRDEVTALDYARNRYYSSTIARFTTADPYGPSARPGAPQTWNRYSYVGGDPVNRNDPSGLQTVVITDEGPPPITRYYWGWFDEMLLNYVLQYSGWWWNAWNDWAASAGEGNVAYVGNKGGSGTDPRTTGPTAWQYLTSNWSNCLNSFTQDSSFDSGAFQRLLSNGPEAGGIIWATDLSQTVGYYANNGDTRVLSTLIPSGAEAYAVAGTNVVAVGKNYLTNLTQTQQIAVAIHEALHLYLGVGDGGLANWLGLYGGFSPTDAFYKYNDTQQITEWIVGTANQMDINGGCQHYPRNP